MTVATLLSALLGALALLWLLVLGRSLRRGHSDRYRVRLGASSQGLPSLAVVIPARDEVDHIGACLDHVFASEHPGLRVVVLDDGSTDGTSAVLRDKAEKHDALTVLDGGADPLPQGWLGKAWACQRASRVALDGRTEWLLFVDADVRLAPGAPAAALRYAVDNELAMLSGFGQLTVISFWERVVQPAVVGMILAGNDLHKANDPERRKGPPLANGQFILVRRDAYLAVDGHAAVRDTVIDDVGLATAVTDKGFPYQLVFMRELFSVRMYDSWAQLWEGWTKNLFAGLGYSWSMTLAVSAFTLLAVVAPYPLAVVGIALGASWGWWALAAVAGNLGLRAWLDRRFGQSVTFGLLTHWLGQLVLVAILLGSAVRSARGTTTWKGRQLG